LKLARINIKQQLEKHISKKIPEKPTPGPGEYSFNDQSDHKSIGFPREK